MKSIAIFFTAVVVTASPNNLPAQSDALDQWLAQTVHASHIAGLSIAAVRDGNVIFKKAYGVRNADGEDPITTGHLFHMASVSKPFVAVAVMQLAQAGKIDLDAPITEYLPYFSINDERLPDVTVRRILSHTAGLPDVEDYEWRQPQTDAGALERWVRTQNDRELIFTPGEDRQYSNIGYEILGDMIAKVSGRSFEDYMRDEVLRPLGMNDSTYLRAEIPESARVDGHTGVTQAFPLGYYPYNRRHAPSSTLHVNADDLAIALNAFASPARLAATGILSPESIAEMWTIQFEMNEHFKMAHGWFWASTEEGALFRHGGADDGFRSEFAVFADIDAGFGLMTNSESAPVEETRDALRSFVVGGALPPIPENKELAQLQETLAQEGTDALVALFAESLANDHRATAYLIFQLGKDLYLSGDLTTANALITGLEQHLSDHPEMQALRAELDQALNTE